MVNDAVSFCGHLCFKNDWAGFDKIKPINVIIGRNNSGKSHLLDLITALCKENFGKGLHWKTRFSGSLEEVELRHYFDERTSGGELVGNHWGSHGRWLMNLGVSWVIDEEGNVRDLVIADDEGPQIGERPMKARRENVERLLRGLKHRLSGSVYRLLGAERDIVMEAPSSALILKSNGEGATNIVRRFIVTSHPKYPREVIQRNLLNALNTIFASDGHFSEIQIKLHDDASVCGSDGFWEIHLGEKTKDLVPLRNSGSGLKTIMLVLLNLLVVPKIDEKPMSRYVFAFEELENNLHPALLRRLLMFLEEFAVRERCTIFLTTHSSTALDLFGVSPNAQITHVIHDGESARTQTVSGHLDKLAIVSSLGAKPSDLLQSNGIIWVEGPSDRVYINRWIEIFSDGKWKEGRDYQCAFYGGALLAHAQVAPDEHAVNDLVNLFKINPNVVVVCDSDRTSRTGAGSKLKGRTQRIKSEIGKIEDACCWITEPKEIEHYLPGAVLAQVFGKDKLPDPQPYKPFFAYAKRKSYLETTLKRKTVDKVELALKACPLMTKEQMAQRFDWASQMEKLVSHIARWNAPDRRG